MLSAVIIIPLAGSIAAGCPVGDLNDDCKVDWDDMLLFAQDWLDPPGSGSKANLDGLNRVDMADFTLLAKNWWVVGQKTGSLRVTIYPQEAINGGAKWRVDEGIWQDSGYTETGLAPGVHKVEFKDTDGWAKPGHKIVEIYNGQTATQSGEYIKPLVISEFMALNDSTLEDPCDPGEFPDWIEIYNPTDTTINLNGWYLANWNSGNPAPNLKDWQFPDVNIGPGEFLVVFASDNDIRDPNAPYLHTNFKLAQSDECIAIVGPDGNSVVHQYTPYPKQLSDISYGLTQSAETLVPSGANVRYHVPTSADAALAWTDPTFNDSEWDAGQTAIGFEAAAEETGRNIGSPSAPGSYSVVGGVYTINGDGEDIGGSADDFYYVYTTLSGDGGITARIKSIEHTHDWAKAGVMIREKLTDTSSHAMMIATPPSGSADIYAFQWANGANRDNRVPGGDVTLPSWVKIVRSGDNFIGYYALDEDGEPGSWVQVGAANIPMADDVYIGLCVTSHTDDTLCAAVFDNVKRAGEIGSDLRDQMLGINASLWTRIDFYVNDPDYYDAMTLRMRYEDGYIAYLNGAEVVKKNFTGTPIWNSTADSDRPDEESSYFETVNLNRFLDVLRPPPQKNVLAVHALNDNVSNEKFLMLPELVLAKNEMIPQYFSTPTPGTFNISGAQGQVSEVWFSQTRGFYDSPFHLTLSTEMTHPDVKIMYTTDGSRPSPTHGVKYIPGSPITIDGTTVIRAVAVRPGRLDSKVETHTYIFPADVMYQSLDGQAPGPNWPPQGYFNGQLMDYGMDRKVVVDDARYSGQTITDALEAVATVSLVTDLDNLFDPSKGIYVNAYGEGRAWERPCSVELIYPPNPQGRGFPDLEQVPDANGGWRWELQSDMRGGFQIDAGVRIRGGFSSSGDNPKHAFRLFFRSAYGDAKLRYPLFGDEGDDEFDHVDLRCSQNYSWAFQGDNKNTMVREVFSRDLQGEMGHPYTRSRYYHVYINGRYWGLYQTQERAEASWGESYMGGDKEYYDVVTSKWAADRQIVPTDGNRAALDRLYDETIAGFHDYERYYRAQGLNIDGTPNDTYERLLDVDNLIDFMIIEYYTGDSDGPGSRFGGLPNNTWGIFNRVNPDGWKWLHHDNEHTLGAGGAGGSVENLVEPFTSAGANRDYFNPHWLHEQLMFSNADYRMKFANHVHHYGHNDGLMTLEKCRYHILNRAYQIDMAIIAESARWGDAKHPSWAHKKDDHWWPEINRLLYEISDPWGRKTYLTPRVETVLQQFLNVDWYPDVAPPVFASMDEYIFMDNPNGPGTIYYTLNGDDPRVPVAQSKPSPPVTLVTENAAKCYLVPTVANGGNLLANKPGEFDVTYYKANITVGSLATAESVISNPSYQSQVIATPSSVINYNNTSCPGHFAGDKPFPGTTIGIDVDDFVIEATGIVQIPSAGCWTFGVHSDAGFSLKLTGPGSFYMDYPSTRAPADSFAVFNVTTPGAYNLRLVFFERGGWSGVELFAAKGSYGAFNSSFRLVGDMDNGGLQVGESNVWFAAYFDSSGWPGGTGGIGYERNPHDPVNYAGLFNINVEAQMYNGGGNPNANTSCYIRVPFTASSVEFNKLILKVRYDDGFIAYLNGGEVARRNFDGAPQWNSNAGSSHDDSAAINFENIDISNHTNLLRSGGNVLAIHALNVSTTCPDFLISAELVANTAGQGDILPGALIYNNWFVLDKSTHIRARVLKHGIWSALTEAIYAIGPVAKNLRTPEIMYHPQDTLNPNDPNEEFIELKNIGVETVNLSLVRFTEGIHFTFPDMKLAPGQRAVVVKDRGAFEAQYGGGTCLIAGEYSGWLDNIGERIKLEDAIGCTILVFEYDDDWYPITDGDGFSLTIIEDGVDPNRWGKKDSWRASAYVGGSPGTRDDGIIPNPGAIVINEVLAHSHGGEPDWIELHNTTATKVDISGWFLSDNDANLMKYRIADGTTIAANDYIVFTEDANFGFAGSDPGCIIPFALSENGEDACLSSAEDGVLTGYRDVARFPAAQTDRSSGRYRKSTGTCDFVFLAHNTPGKLNAYPQVGPIVISKIMYNPPSGNQNEEYIELYNITSSSVTLYRSDKGLPWKFTDGIEFTFPSNPADPSATIPAYGYLLVAKNTQVFLAWYQAQYGALPPCRVLGPFSGNLQNGGENLQLGLPGDVDELGIRYYIRVDSINYSDGSHHEDFDYLDLPLDPWPTEPDGGGMSLTRINRNCYGNDPNNWTAAAPSPGRK